MAKPPKSVALRDPQLDLRPDGKESFKDFAKSKSPSDNNEKIVVAVYYLEDVMEIRPCNMAQVYTCFEECDWRLPTDPSNAISQVKSKKGFIQGGADTLTLTPKGRNLVKHDLPEKKA